MLQRRRVGQLLLAFYVVAFYGRAALNGRFKDWNRVLPNGYEAGAVFLNLLLGLHLAFAVVIIVGGALRCAAAASAGRAFIAGTVASTCWRRSC